MTSFRIIAIPSKIADLVRTTRSSPGYGHLAHTDTATGYGPCRHCLRTFRIGEEQRTLFTYDPFHGLAPFPLPGPVFIHATACPRYPEEGPFPADLESHSLTILGYGAERRQIAEHHVSDGQGKRTIETLFENSDVDYIHIRDTEAGCYDFGAVRSNGVR